MKNRLFTAALAGSALFLAACAESPYADSHAIPRETQDWENVDLSGYSKEQLLAHLSRLSIEATAAAANEKPVEFHHLEVAITPTLEALESTADGNAKALATIASMKTLAIKLHDAGHDGNSKMGATVATSLTELSSQLYKEL